VALVPLPDWARLRKSLLVGLGLMVASGWFAPNDNQPRKEWVSFLNHDVAMSESNDSRIEAAECLRRANSCDDSQDRWAWLLLAKSWLVLAETQEIAENSIEANNGEPALAKGEANTAQHRDAA
jgi:hypothetical protein